MNALFRFLRTRRSDHAVPIAAAYALIGLLLIPSYQYVLNPDGTAYVSLARLYAAGHVREAVSAYWGPLYSMAMVPFLWAGIDGLAAARAVSLFGGLLAFVAVRVLARRLAIDHGVAAALYLTMAVVLWYAALTIVSPDALLSCLLLCLGTVVSSPRFGRSPSVAATAGLIAGFAFLTKSVALPVALVVIACAVLLRVFAERRFSGRLLVSAVVAIAVLAAVSVPWLVLVQRLHGELPFDVSYRVNHFIEGPGARFPMFTEGLMPPPPLGFSAWDDPGSMHMPGWEFGSPAEERLYAVKFLALNAADAVHQIQRLSWLSLAIVAGCVILLVRNASPWPRRNTVLVLLFACAAIAGAYAVVHVEERYLWPVVLLLLPSGALVASNAIERMPSGIAPRAAIVGAFMLSFVLMPASRLIVLHGDGRAFAGRVTELAARHELAGARIASDHWKQGLFVSFVARGSYYGQSEPGGTDADVEAELLEHDIDYYLGFAPDAYDFALYEKVEEGRDLVLYARTD